MRVPGVWRPERCWVDHQRQTSLFHFGLIPDGARRWARRTNTDQRAAYRMTMDKITEYCRFSFSRGVTIISLYLASSDNLRQRESGDVHDFLEAETWLVTDLLPELARHHKTAVHLAGASDLLPTAYREAVRGLVCDSSANDQTHLYLCAGYDPLLELEAAYSEHCGSGLERDDFLSSLWVPYPLDFVIRTGGVRRLSNFLPLQAGYAEIKFLDELFLDTSLDDIERAFDQFAATPRRFGR